MRPVSTKPARAHGLPKIHKTFDTLPPFRPRPYENQYQLIGYRV